MLTTKSPATIPPFGLTIGRDPFPGAGARVVGHNLTQSRHCVGGCCCDLAARSTACPSPPLPFGERGLDRARAIAAGLDDGRAEPRRTRRRAATHATNVRA